MSDITPKGLTVPLNERYNTYNRALYDKYFRLKAYVDTMDLFGSMEMVWGLTSI